MRLGGKLSIEQLSRTLRLLAHIVVLEILLHKGHLPVNTIGPIFHRREI